MSQDVSNIKVEPMSVTWGTDTIQVETVTLVADVAGSLNNKYFFIYKTDGTKYHVWFNINSAGSDPAPGGSTAVPVTGATGATAATLATAAASAIDALSGHAAAASSAVVTITHAVAGYAQQAHEGVGTGFSFSLTTEGDAAADIGFVDGEIEHSPKEDLLDITAQQTGSNILSQIRKGKKVTIKLTFQETSVTQMKRILRQAGSSFTPAGAGGTELTGYGSHRDFTQTLTQSKKLVLHPMVLGSSDHSRDYTFHLAYPMIDKINHSGEAKHMVPVEFMIYPKLANNDRIEYFCFGDGTQTLT